MDAAAAVLAGQGGRTLKYKRRVCKATGCSRTVKSQGVCQKHGAKPRKCLAFSCQKQAQGNFDGFCKSHFKAAQAKETTSNLPRRHGESGDQSVRCKEISAPPSDFPEGGPLQQGESVFDVIIPSSIAWRPQPGSSPLSVMPLVAHLKAGFDAGKPPAWHRNEERHARGYPPVTSPALQLRDWERQLVWTEILLLTGNPASSFRHLARAWGRDKGFQTVLAQFICERRGEVERKGNLGNAVRRRTRLEDATSTILGFPSGPEGTGTSLSTIDDWFDDHRLDGQPDGERDTGGDFVEDFASIFDADFADGLGAASVVDL